MLQGISDIGGVFDTFAMPIITALVALNAYFLKRILGTLDRTVEIQNSHGRRLAVHGTAIKYLSRGMRLPERFDDDDVDDQL